MADKQQIPQDVLFDTRLVERHIKAGMTTRKEVEARLKASPDLAEQAAAVNLNEAAGKRPSR